MSWKGDEALKVLEAWQAVDLKNVQLSLDEQATLVVENQSKFLESRKSLAETTKAFKRNEKVAAADAESPVKVLVPSLLKAYQNEVNGLTSRAKLSEACFLQLYRMMRETPDPSPVISSALSNVSQMTERLESVERELEVSKRKEAELRSELEGKSHEGTSSTEIERLVDEGVEFRVREKVAELEERLFEARTKAEEEVSVVNSELQLALSEAEQLSSRVKYLESELTNREDEDREGAKGRVAELEALVRERDGTLQVALEDAARFKGVVRTLEDRLKDAEEQVKLQLHETAQVVEKSTAEISTLKEELTSRPSKEEHQRLRNQLLAMQQSLYNVETDTVNAESSAKESDEVALKKSDVQDDDNDPELDTLDAWLLESNRKLKKQVVELRESLSEEKRKNQELQSSLQSLDEALRDKDALTDKLEGELASVPMQSNVDVVESNANEGVEGSASARAADVNGGNATKSPESQQLMLQAISSQRDRFRAQVDEKDEQIEELQRSVREAVEQAKTLKEDNVQLSQRIRFLQSYKVSERSTLLADQVATGNVDIIVEKGAEGASFKQKGLGRGVEHKYKQVYDSPSNPFQSFQQAEVDRLIPKGIEKVVVRVLNPFLTRSRGRKFMFFYLIFLHVGFMLALSCRMGGS